MAATSQHLAFLSSSTVSGFCFVLLTNCEMLKSVLKEGFCALLLSTTDILTLLQLMAYLCIFKYFSKLSRCIVLCFKTGINAIQFFSRRNHGMSGDEALRLHLGGGNFNYTQH